MDFVKQANGEARKVSRQYRAYLRKVMVGICGYGGCHTQRVNSMYCEIHRLQDLARRKRIRDRQRDPA